MSIERTLIGLLLAKIETNYGIDPTPSAGSNIIAVRRSAVKYDQKWTHLERAILDGSLAKLGGLNVLPEIGLSFDVEVRGNRTDGIAADISAGSNAHAIEIDPLLQACDLQPTYTAESAGGARDGKVVYTPYVPTDMGKSVTFYFYTGLKLHKITGAKGSVKASFKGGEIAVLTFDFKGLFNLPTDAGMPGDLTFLNTVPPLFQNTGSKVSNGGAGFSPIFQKLDFDLATKVDKREDANSANGVAGFIITDRAPKVSIDPESVAEASHPIWGDLNNSTVRTITASMGTQAGNKCALTFTGVSSQVAIGDRSGVRTQQIDYMLERANLSDTPGNECQLQFS